MEPLEGGPQAQSVSSAEIVARLEGLRRLAMGAAHALNNAFTTLVGETSFLQEDRKADPVVTEACDTILAELDRCTRITRALLARRSPPQRGADEVELVRLVRDLGLLLQETLGRQHHLVVETPDELAPVAGSADELETLVLALVHYAADTAGGSSTLHLRVEPPAHGEVRLCVEVQAPRLPADSPQTFLAPDRARDPVTAAVLAAVDEMTVRLGGRREATHPAPDAWCARISLPALP